MPDKNNQIEWRGLTAIAVSGRHSVKFQIPPLDCFLPIKRHVLQFGIFICIFSCIMLFSSLRPKITADVNFAPCTTEFAYQGS